MHLCPDMMQTHKRYMVKRPPVCQRMIETGNVSFNITKIFSNFPKYFWWQKCWKMGDKKGHLTPWWKSIFLAVAPDDENVEIISCDTAQAIKRFKEGDLDQIGDIKGAQLTEDKGPKFGRKFPANVSMYGKFLDNIFYGNFPENIFYGKFMWISVENFFYGKFMWISVEIFFYGQFMWISVEIFFMENSCDFLLKIFLWKIYRKILQNFVYIWKTHVKNSPFFWKKIFLTNSLTNTIGHIELAFI